MTRMASRIDPSSDNVSRAFLGTSVYYFNLKKHHCGWRWTENFPIFMPPDTLKMHSSALPVLRFLCKLFGIQMVIKFGIHMVFK